MQNQVRETRDWQQREGGREQARDVLRFLFFPPRLVLHHHGDRAQPGDVDQSRKRKNKDGKTRAREAKRQSSAQLTLDYFHSWVTVSSSQSCTHQRNKLSGMCSRAESPKQRQHKVDLHIGGLQLGLGIVADFYNWFNSDSQAPDSILTQMIRIRIFLSQYMSIFLYKIR